MTNEEFKALDAGSIIRHKHASESMVVTANYGTHVVAVRTAHVTNPTEWELVLQQGPAREARIAAHLTRIEERLSSIARGQEDWRRDEALSRRRSLTGGA